MLAPVLLIAYLMATIAIGFILSGKNKSSDELYVARDKLSIPMLSVLIFGEIIAASSVTGSAQGAYDQGISALSIFIGKGAGLILFALFLVPFFTQAGKAKIVSNPSLFGWRFDEKTRFVATILLLCPLVLMCSAQIKACASLVAPLFGVSSVAMVIFLGALFAILGCTGLRGIANMNLLHSFLVFSGILVASMVCVKSAGGIEAITAKLPESHMNLAYPSAAKVSGDFATALLAFVLSVTPTSACYSSGSVPKNRISLIIAGVVTTLFAFLPVVIGLCGAATMPGIDSNAVIYLMPSSVSPEMGLVVTIAIVAVVVSTAPFLFLSAATILVKDVLMLAKRDLSDKGQMNATYVMLAVVALLAIWAALGSTSIFNQVVSANHIKATASVVIIAGIVSRRLTNTAAFSALVVSGVVSVGSVMCGGTFFGTGVEPFWPALALSIAVMTLVSLLDGKHRKHDWETWRRRWDASEDHRTQEKA